MRDRLYVVNRLKALTCTIVEGLRVRVCRSVMMAEQVYQELYPSRARKEAVRLGGTV